MIIFETTINLQRKWDIDTKTKIIKRECKNIIWIWVKNHTHKNHFVVL